MPENPDQEPPRLGQLMLAPIGNFALAFAVGFVISKLMLWFGVSNNAVLAVYLIVFFTILYVDPVSAYLNGKSKRDLLVKLAVGLAIALVTVPVIMSLGGNEGEATEGAVSAAENDAGLGLGVVWMMLPILLIVPLVFMAPLAEKVIKRDQNDARVSADDLQISATFPIYVTVTMFLNLGVPGALWLLGASLPVAGAVMIAGTLLCVLEVWTADPDDLVPDVDATEWGPRAESAAEAWAGLRKGLQQCFASALFLGAAIYISIELAVPYFPDVGLTDTHMLGFLIGVITASGIVLVSSLSLIGLGVLVQVGAALWLGRSQGADPLTIVELIKQSQMRLLAGGMHWVRPDLETD